MSTPIPKEVPRIARMRVENLFIFDSFLLMFYTAIVYVWGLTVYPMGRDYAAMESNGADLPFLADRIFAWELRTFGDSIVPYHLVNLVGLYACAWCVMHLTNFTVRGIWWLGTWAAVIFMANPVHTESALNLSGIGDLIPAFFGLFAMTAYSYHAYATKRWTFPVTLAAFAFASFAYPQFAFLFLVLIMYEVLITSPDKRNFSRLIPITAAGVAAAIYHWPTLRESSLDLAAWFAPLYFTFYPIGFLPESAATMHHRPWLGWAAAVAVAVILWLIYRKARRPAILFGLLSMFVLRCFPSVRPVDPVHLIGGGDLVVASALFTVAFTAVVYRCMDHPKWKVPIVGMTTAFALAVALVQVRSELHWRAAGTTVRTFQATANAAASEDNVPIRVLPDWQYYRGAPLQLSESIRYDTPFSRALNHESILTLNAHALEDDAVVLLEGGRLRVNGARPVEIVPWPYPALEAGDTLSESATIQSVDDDGFTLSIHSVNGLANAMPAALTLGKEASGEAESGTGDE